MNPIRDPEENEVKQLLDIGKLANGRVVEIGCGNGRLTQRYAPFAASIAALDPNLAKLAEAKQQELSNTHFLQAGAEELPFASNSFDVALFAWSL